MIVVDIEDNSEFIEVKREKEKEREKEDNIYIKIQKLIKSQNTFTHEKSFLNEEYKEGRSKPIPIPNKINYFVPGKY